MLLALAWRNIWRNRKRSAIIVTAIVLGLCGGLFATGFMEGMVDEFVASAIDRGLAHVQIHAHGFTDDRNITQSIPDFPRVLSAAHAAPGVTAVSARMIVTGLISSPTTAQGVQLTGVAPDDERGVSSVPTQIVKGTYFDNARNAIVLGARLAKKLDVKLHAKVVLSFAGPDGTLVALAGRVAGIFSTPSSVFDESMVFMRRADLASVIGGDLVHEVAIRTTATPDSVAASLRAALPALDVATWKQLAPEVAIYTDFSTLENVILLGIILFSLMFGITNTMLMSVLERVREFGVLLAVGMNRRRVFGLIVLETALLSLTGSAVGTGLGALLTAWFHHAGIDLSIVSEGLSMYGLASVVYPTIPGPLYAMLAGMVAATAVIAALYPGWKAVHLRPAEAIRAAG